MLLGKNARLTDFVKKEHKKPKVVALPLID
jgi:hypothetical protein